MPASKFPDLSFSACSCLHAFTYTLYFCRVGEGKRRCRRNSSSAALEQQAIQYPSLKEALQLDWSALHPRRTHKLIGILAVSFPMHFASSPDTNP